MKIGDNIKEIREKEKGLKKEDVAKALGISTKAYSNIESNSSDITLTRLYELSDIFGVSPDYILNYQDKSSFTNHFNNYDGNQGVIILYQGCSEIKNLEEQLKQSRDTLKNLQSKSQDKE
ncbi:MAG: helix-turn-helix transcriptional regulator [Arachidicoccus sp.]|nr:helix-turn-helix transcriptional regulator [Arachidicoccus sp.]